ncbi:type II toxin-antitoxin system HicA family toxin [Candidatus Magnetominusculus xianensis]|uniref:Toxin HicA n=1 Tax=Candidatus Magnetominusculus xianensis TaxID=1748249 RepID=A0ABR5SF53_9BACT|nr:type II toxin-antitoxin system HicA family toxin [Candidatus Magnetominusculus xianensis]KWT82663.1 toxin HicA [Candidatus Magnetominusculus xianensis]MBF0405325.1 type II toxin-antitoxin system HicA family toxin [Nitrospirota bacterium]
MGKYEKLKRRVLSNQVSANIAFDDICLLLKHFGFEERVRGSHHIFRKQGIDDKINLQRDDNNRAKIYQIRQVRAVIRKYNLED